jgi:parallel beta-helix repeat protein
MKGTAPTIEGNVCYQNGMAGIGCRDAAAPVIRKNRCYENELAGIGCDGARPTITENVCYRNKQAGIGLRDGARAAVLKNECYENELAGIGHWGDVESVVEGNHVHHNKTAGIGFEECTSGTATVLNNKVLENGTVAIGIHTGWTVRAAGNELARKDGLPPIVMVFKGADADLSDNTITGSRVAGIRTEGTVRATGNTFTCATLRKAGPPQFAVWALPGANVALVKNTVRGWRHALVAEKAALTVLDNVVSDYLQTGIRVSQSAAPPVVTGNVFTSDALHTGVTAPAGEGIVENNRVEKPGPKK